MQASRSQPLVEMRAIAEGTCASGMVPNCNVDDFFNLIRLYNLLPELIKMTCSMFGAWGSATPSGLQPKEKQKEEEGGGGGGGGGREYEEQFLPRNSNAKNKTRKQTVMEEIAFSHNK